MNLFPHQIEVLEKTKNYNRCAYYLDMGLGKTFVGSEKMIQMLTGVNLVVCQKSKVDDWCNHFKKYYSERPYLTEVLDLTKKANLDRFVVLAKEDKEESPLQLIGIINYDLVWRRVELRSAHDFTLMLDESSLIANEKTKRSKFILSLKPSNVVLLSGTPCSGKYENLYSQCRLLGWPISKYEFYNRYIITKKVDFGLGFLQEIVVGYKNVEELKNKLREYGAVFMKTEEVIDLPEQIHQKIMVESSKEYSRFRKDRYVVIDGKELVGENTLTKILYERQLCGVYSKNKLAALNDLFESTNDRLVVFYNFNDEIKQILSIIPQDRHVSVINGSTKDLRLYEKYEDTITLVQYQAGAMGLNLQKANKVIYYTLPLGKGSCDLWEQSKKRIHRIGQNKSCFYYYLLIENSIEEWNLKLLEEGKELTDALFEEGNDGSRKAVRKQNQRLSQV